MQYGAKKQTTKDCSKARRGTRGSDLKAHVCARYPESAPPRREASNPMQKKSRSLPCSRKRALLHMGPHTASSCAHALIRVPSRMQAGSALCAAQRQQVVCGSDAPVGVAPPGRLVGRAVVLEHRVNLRVHLCVGTCTRASVHLCVCISERVCTHGWMDACMHACTHICMNRCMDAWI